MEQYRSTSFWLVGLRVFGGSFFALAVMLAAVVTISTNSAHAQQAPNVPKLECAPHEKVTQPSEAMTCNYSYPTRF